MSKDDLDLICTENISPSSSSALVQEEGTDAAVFSSHVLLRSSFRP